MNIEYEATFEKVDKDEMRRRLKKAGAKLIDSDFLQKRDVFSTPDNNENSWLRVRAEKGKNTMSLKSVDGDKIENQREICIEIDGYDEAKEFLEKLGCKWKSYQETRRELWKLGSVEISIDEWPFLEPFVEIEGSNENEVVSACEKLELDYNKALFCAIGELYKRKYGASLDQINNKTSRITFDMENPFENNEK